MHTAQAGETLNVGGAKLALATDRVRTYRRNISEPRKARSALFKESETTVLHGDQEIVLPPLWATVAAINLLTPPAAATKYLAEHM